MKILRWLSFIEKCMEKLRPKENLNITKFQKFMIDLTTYLINLTNPIE